MRNDQGIDNHVTMNVQGVERLIVGSDVLYDVIVRMSFEPGIPLLPSISFAKNQIGYMRTTKNPIWDNMETAWRLDNPRLQFKTEYVAPERQILEMGDGLYKILMRRNDSFTKVSNGIATFLVQTQGRGSIDFSKGETLAEVEPELEISYCREGLKEEIDKI